MQNFSFGLYNSADLIVYTHDEHTMAFFEQNEQQDGSERVHNLATAADYLYIPGTSPNAEEGLFCHLSAGPVSPISPCLPASLAPFLCRLSATPSTRKDAH